MACGVSRDSPSRRKVFLPMSTPSVADAGHHLALGQMLVADEAGQSIVGLERRMPGRELSQEIIGAGIGLTVAAMTSSVHHLV